MPVFFPSEILHSKDLQCAFAKSSPSSSSSSSSDDEESERSVIFICHKDKTTFYKATRKACRTAVRIWSASGATVDAAVDGYFVGRDAADSALHKRLASEFGPLSGPIAVGFDRFSSCAADGSALGDRANAAVVFFDMDGLDSTQIHHDTMQNVMSRLKHDLMMDKDESRIIVHLRSETIYRSVASILSTTTSKEDALNEKKLRCVSSLELEKHLTSDSQTDGDGGSASCSPDNTNVIRRLRQNKGALNCPLTVYPARYVELPFFPDVQTVEICRFHNYDAERGCLRSKKAKENSEVKGCNLDHDHCHSCGGLGHRAFECHQNQPNDTRDDDRRLDSVVFRNSPSGEVISIPFCEHNSNHNSTRNSTSLPALLVLGGRLRGRTLATCEMLPLSPALSNSAEKHQQWVSLPNLSEHRGSHAACSPVGSRLAFVMGGGTADGNSDAVEILDFGSTQRTESSIDDGGKQRDDELKWHTMSGRLSSPRHAFGAVSCMTTRQVMGKDEKKTSVSLFAVGGWKYGSVSNASLERLRFEYLSSLDGTSQDCINSEWLHNQAQWECKAPLLLPRRLHSVVASTGGSSIYVFGGYVDERRTTESIERYDINEDRWHAADKLPFGENCPLVQAVADLDGFLIFPFSTEDEAPTVLRYSPGCETPFSRVSASPGSDLRLPIANWHSFSATSSSSLNKAYLVGGTISGKWTDRSYELDLQTLQWKELPRMTFPRRRLATAVLE